MTRQDWIVTTPVALLMGALAIGIGYPIFGNHHVPTPQEIWIAKQKERCHVMGGRLTTTVADTIVSECYRHVFWRQSTNRLFKEEFNDRK